jgi:spore coat protein U-like protein
MRLILALIAALFLPGIAQAACTVGPTSIGFGSANSYAVQASTVAATSGLGGLSCTGTPIVLLSGNSARATVTSARGFRLGGPTGDLIPYRLSANASGTRNFTQGSTIDFYSADLIGLLNGSNLQPVFHAAIQGSANVAAGTYTDTLTVQWTWNMCRLANLGGICVLPETGSGTAIVTVTVTVVSDCRISAPPVDFGSAALARQFISVTQAVLVDCTKGSSYSVTLTSGSNGTARPWRTMRSAGGNVLRYNLYRSDGSTIWDESNPLASPTPGTGATVPGQPFTYRARIDPDQVTPPAGSYSDTVSVVISF